MNVLPSKDDFKKEIEHQIDIARSNGANYIDINSGDIHRKLGGYPGKDGKHAMPSCCDAMYSLKKPNDEILIAPPKGKGATLEIRFYIII
ncbi:hypothetical protein PPOLYM_02575 [Paenibacillus polymyxa]|uniref:hypothetical protein n=1 Tax=Paenibacillus polymyxa TaxID=1406 RepID=UPI0009D72C39|nr:hypothetical protein [Paenibacillus polymyxa]VUG06182.1 hypothetical protein PPOLYM_02575 [Paenibacillus polymyxa]